MNDENLEQHLRNLPAPELPEEWRAEILSRAKREARASQPRQVWPTLLINLRNLYLRNPITATAMTSLWMLIFLFKFSTPVDLTDKTLLAHIDPNRPIYLVSLRDEIRLAELLQDQGQEERRQIP